MNGLALCAGAGGLELGMRLALGPDYRCVGYVERDAFAAAALVARMEDAALDRAPVWDDLLTFNGRPWRGRVDLVTAGFPCQPVSDAGKRLGIADERWLWPHIVPILEAAAPPLAFFENVPPLVAHGLDVVLGDLAALGFHAEWADLSAATVGATQRRDRVWILAYRDECRLPQFGHLRERIARDHLRGPSRPNVANPDGAAGRQRTRISQSDRGAVEPARSGCVVADANGAGRERPARPAHVPGPRPEPGSATVPVFPPGPDADAGWQAVLVERADLEPSLHRMVDGLAYRVDRHRVIGNGVVPLVAAHAFLGLARRAGLVNQVTAPPFEELRLFDLPEQPAADVDPPGLSDTRRRTLRNQALIESGVHPATHLALRDGAACGSCAHLVGRGERGRRFYKCGLVPITAGPGSDIRLSWPACVRWAAADEWVLPRRTVNVETKGEVL